MELEESLRRPHDTNQSEENIPQTVVITTYCDEHKVPSAMRFFRHIVRTSREIIISQG